MIEPFGTAIFCDDIRFETLNKASLMGMYGSELLLFGTFPTLLPKLGIFAMARFHASEKIEGAKILVYFPGDTENAPTYSEDLPLVLDAALYPRPNPEEYPDPSDYLGFNHPVLLSPVTIKQPGYIRVRVLAGKHRVKIGALKLREASSEEASLMGIKK